MVINKEKLSFSQLFDIGFTPAESSEDEKQHKEENRGRMITSYSSSL